MPPPACRARWSSTPEPGASTANCQPARVSSFMSFAVSDAVRIFIYRLPAEVVEQVGPLVQAWVRNNKDALLAFSNDGYRWSREELNQFLLALRKYEN